MEPNKIRCTCVCHSGLAGSTFMHMQACCDNGWITLPVVKEKQYLTNKDFLQYYYEDIGTITEQFSVEYSGQVRINPDWKFEDNNIGGKTYIVKPKKDEA